jgi:hypothetical protein
MYPDFETNWLKLISSIQKIKTNMLISVISVICFSSDFVARYYIKVKIRAIIK